MQEGTKHRKTMRRRDTGTLRYITFSCIDKLPLLSNVRIKDAFVRELAECQRRTGLLVSAWVVMHNHCHILCWPGPRGHELAPALSGLKSNFARMVIQRWRELDAKILERITGEDGKPHLWMPGGGFDRNLFTDRAISNTIEYIHMNPVRRRLAKDPLEYHWSSARAWKGDRSGLVQITSPWAPDARLP